ncbi:MAG: alpha/beta fold hydrolase [Acidimicrobiia bacterium]
MPDLETSDGVGLRWVTTGSQDAPPLLLLHGLGSDGEAFDAVAAAIGDRLHLVRLDLRGHGRSEPLTEPERYGWFDRVATDVIELCDALGWDRPVLVGGSLGAAVTTATVLAHPDRVARVGLIAPAIGAGVGLDNAVAVGFMQGVQALGLVGFLDQLVAGMPEMLDPDSLELVRASYGRQDDAAMRACCASLAAAVLVDDLDRLTTITQPALVVGRRGDPLHPFEMAEAYASRLPDCRLVEDTGATPFDQRPGDLADLLVGFAE